MTTSAARSEMNRRLAVKPTTLLLATLREVETRLVSQVDAEVLSVLHIAIVDELERRMTEQHTKRLIEIYEDPANDDLDAATIYTRVFGRR